MPGADGIQLAYSMVLGAMFAALVKERASFARILVAPFAAVAVTLLASMALALLSLPWGLIASAAAGLRIMFNTALLLIMGYAAGRWLARLRPASLHSLYQRGAALVGRAQAEVAAAAGAAAPAGSLTLAGVPVPGQDETKHFKFIGATGTGKSTAIRELLGAALARGDRAVIADPDGGCLVRFYDLERGDVILNPFHAHSRKWDLFAEIDADQDIEQLSRSLIPQGKDGERACNDYARTFLGELIRHCRRRGIAGDQTLHNLVTATSQTDLREILAQGPAGPFLAAGNEGMFAPVRSVAASALRVLALISTQEGPPFSVRRWVREGSGVLFLPYTAGEIAGLRTVISAWMRLAISELMAGPEGDRHLWFIVDELDALGAIDGLRDVLARLGKFGGRCVLGLQSIAQVSLAYGHGAAQTIGENTGNTLILRCPDSERGGTAQYASHLIGEQQILRRIISRRVRAFFPALPLLQVSEQPSTQAVVRPSQIERLPELEGFLKLASYPDWRYVRLAPESAPSVLRGPFVPAVQPAAGMPAGEPGAPAEPVDKEHVEPAGPAAPVLRIKPVGAPKRARRKAPAAAPATAAIKAVAPAPAMVREAARGEAPGGSEAPAPEGAPAPLATGISATPGEGGVPQDPKV